MDFDKCFALLEARMEAGPPVAASLPPPPRTSLPEVLKDSEDLTPVGSIQLIKKFNDLQTERIKTYKYFDQELNDIIEGNAPARYPFICSEVTQRFSQISSSINGIKDVLQSRGHTEIAQGITKVQTLEKDKLMLVAAHHLDQLKSTVLQGTEKVTGEKTEEQVVYLAKQIATCQSNIAEALEDIRCNVCDLAEEES